MCLSSLFLVQALTLQILKLTLASLSSHSSTEAKCQDKHINISRTKKAFFIFFNGFSVVRNFLRPVGRPLNIFTKNIHRNFLAGS